MQPFVRGACVGARGMRGVCVVEMYFGVCKGVRFSYKCSNFSNACWLSVCCVIIGEAIRVTSFTVWNTSVFRRCFPLFMSNLRMYMCVHEAKRASSQLYLKLRALKILGIFFVVFRHVIAFFWLICLCLIEPESEELTIFILCTFIAMLPQAQLCCACHNWIRCCLG